jgi:hypothetical protein
VNSVQTLKAASLWGQGQGQQHLTMNPANALMMLCNTEGSITTDQPGTWVMVFDNSYSIFRSKTVYYAITAE